MDDEECVPTSVMLAHAFASLDVSALPPGLEQVKIFGADVQNPRFQCVSAGRQSSGFWTANYSEAYETQKMHHARE